MKIHKIFSEFVETNVYLIEDNKEAILIDAGANPKKILDFLKQHNLTLKFILMTHNHIDHSKALNEIKNSTSCNVCMSEKDRDIAFGSNISDFEDIKDNQEFIFNKIKLTAIATPGHTAGSFSFYIKDEDILFSGDTLFREGIGRIDLPTSSEKDMKSSLKKLLSLPSNTKVFPGHGDETTIENEKDLYSALY